MSWAVDVAEAVAREWLNSDHPEWHGGHEAALQIADLLRRAPTEPRVTPAQERVLRRLRDTRCATGEPVLLRVTARGRGRIFWHRGGPDGTTSEAVFPVVIQALVKNGLVERVESPREDEQRYALSVVGRLVLSMGDAAAKAAAEGAVHDRQ